MANMGIVRFGGAVIVGRAFQLMAFFALAHELSPSQMGVVALLTAVFVGFFSLTNFGFDRYIIFADNKTSQEVSHTIDVIWTLQLIRGCFILVMSGMVALLIDNFSSFDVTRLYFICIGIALLIFNISNPHVVIYEREGNFSYAALLKGVSTSVSGIAVLGLVLIWADPWVYVIGQIINTSIYAFLSYKYSELTPKLSIDKAAMQEVLSYCKHLLLMAAVSFVAVQFENFFVAFVFGPAVLGVYFTWSRVIQLPREIISQIMDRILFSKACVIKRDNGDFSKLHLFGLTVMVLMVLPYYIFMWHHGAWVISIVAGVEWVEFWWMGKYFILINFFFLLSMTVAPFTLSCFPAIASRLRVAESVGLVLLMAWMGLSFGVEGVLWAALTSIVLATVVRLYILYAKIIKNNYLKHACYGAGVMFLVPFLVLPGEWFFSAGTGNSQPLIGLFVWYVVCYLAFLALFLYSRTRFFRLGGTN